MKEKIVSELKNELVNIKCNSEIGKILYDKSLKSKNFNIFIPAIDDVLELFKNIVHHLEIYSEACRENYKKHHGIDFDDANNNEEDTIVGRGSIEIVKDNNKLKIVLECE